MKHRCLIMAKHCYFRNHQWKEHARNWIFKKDTISIFNDNIPLITINSGHYTIPNTKAKQMINNTDWETETSTQIFLSVAGNQDNWSTALKLHRELAQWWRMHVLKSSYHVGGPWGISECNKSWHKIQIIQLYIPCSTNDEI